MVWAEGVADLQEAVRTGRNGNDDHHDRQLLGSGTMPVVSDTLRFASVAALGLFVGAMLTEGCVLVPYWRSLPPAVFFGWYAANDRRLLGFFGPLTVLAVLFAVAAAGASWWQGHAARWPALAAAALSVTAAAMFPLYFERANASFAAASIAPGELPASLARWAAWHWLRTALSLIALAAAVCSAWRGR